MDHECNNPQSTTRERDAFIADAQKRSAEQNLSTISDLDKLRTFKSAAEALGLPYHKVQRAAVRKLIPTYSIGDTKKYVRLRDILALVEGRAA